MQSYESYPINFALMDVMTYHQSCSFMFVLQKAIEEGAQNTPEHDIVRLTQRLRSIALERDNKIAQLKAVTPKLSDEQIRDDFELKQIEERYKPSAKN